MAKRWDDRRVWTLVATICAILYLGVLIYNVEEGQHDFATYFYAAKAAALGLDPYSLEDLSQAAGQRMIFKFVYPRYTLWIFRPFTWLGYDAARYTYFGLKCLALILLVLIWRRAFLHARFGPLFVFFLLLAFRGSVHADFFSGNIAIFETTLLWAAFAWFLEGRYKRFCLLVIVCGLFKLAPLVFLMLLLLAPGKRKHGLLLGSLAAAGALVLLLHAGQLESLRVFFETALRIDERGETNPALLALIRDLMRPELKSTLAVAVYGAIALLVSGLTLRTMLILSRRDREAWRTFMFLFAVSAIILIMPRVKDYFYIMLVVPAFLIISVQRPRGMRVAAFVIFMLGGIAAIALPKPYFPYYALFLSFLNWGLYMREARRETAPVLV